MLVMIALRGMSPVRAPCVIGQQQLWLALFCALWRLYSVFVWVCCCYSVVAGKLQEMFVLRTAAACVLL